MPGDGTFQTQYQSLAEALLSFKALTGGTDIGNLVGLDPIGAAQLVAPGTGLNLNGVSTQQDLQTVLTTSGATLDLNGISSFDALYAEMAAKSKTLDGGFALESASYMSQLSSLRVPQLDSPGELTMPMEGMAFGLFMNKSLTNLISNSPNVFAAVSATGLGTAGNLTAFKQAMTAASSDLGTELSRLPMPCLADMMEAMGTGVARSSNKACQPCAATGAYLHQGALSLLDPRVNNVNPSANTTPQLDNMPPWLSDALQAQNPQLTAQLNSVVAPTGVAATCGVGQAGTSATLSGTLPGVFGNLSTGNSSGAQLPGVFGNMTSTAPAGTNAPTATLPGVFGNLQGPK